MSEISENLSQLRTALSQPTADSTPLLQALGESGLSAIDLIVHVERWRVENSGEAFESNALELLDLLHGLLPAEAKQPLQLNGASAGSEQASQPIYLISISGDGPSSHWYFTDEQLAKWARFGNRETRPPQAFADAVRRRGSSEIIELENLLAEGSDEEILDCCSVNEISGSFYEDKVHQLTNAATPITEDGASGLADFLSAHPEFKIVEEFETIWY